MTLTKPAKRILCMVLLPALLLLVSSCGDDGQDAAGFSREDLYLNIGEARYELNANIETVLSALGSDYAYSEGISCDYDGLDKTFLYSDAEFYTWPMAEGDLINEIYLKSPSVTTSKGISVGSARKDVLASYGEDCEDTGYQLIYSAEEGSLCFDLEGDVVTAVYIIGRPM